MFEQSDETLVTKANKGHTSAWVKLVKRHERAIYNYGLRMTGNSADALDLTQDVFLAVLKSLHSFRGESSFKTWLYRIANYRAIEIYRKKRHFEEAAEIQEHGSEEHSPHTITQNEQTKNHVVKAMQGLPFEQRSVVELKYFSHFTFDEIAAQLDLPASTVKTRLYTALAKMKDYLEVNDVPF